MVMKSFDRFPEKRQTGGVTTTTINYYDPIEILEIEDEDYKILEMDD